MEVVVVDDVDRLRGGVRLVVVEDVVDRVSDPADLSPGDDASEEGDRDEAHDGRLRAVQIRRKRRSVRPLPIAETPIATQTRTSARVTKGIVCPDAIRLKLLA